MSRKLPDAVWVFLGFFALGLWGMAPSVSFGDSGELIAAAATLSVPHAPGYPLFCLLGHALGTALPWAGWAYAVNLLSVLCGALALALLFGAMTRAGLSRAGAAVGTLTLGLSSLWLHTSLQAEVFALHLLAAAAALWVLSRFHDDFFAPRPMAALGLVMGLGGANHQTLILIVPALLAAGWLHARPSGKRLLKGSGWLLCFGLLGLAVYLYLPIRARVSPPLDWGHPADLKGFLHVLLRKDYGSFALTVEGAAGSRWGALWPQTSRWLASFWSGFGPAGAALSLLGCAFWLTRRGPRLHWALPALWIFCAGPGFLWLGNPPFDPLTSGALERFYLLSWLPAALLAAAGADALFALVPRHAPVLAAALAAVPLLSGVFRAPSWRQRSDLAARDYGMNVLRSMAPGSMLFMDGGDDTFYTMAYLRFAEGRRPDVSPHDRGGLVFPSVYGGDFRSLSKPDKEERRRLAEAAYAGRRPVYYSTLNDDILPSRRLELWGLLRRIDGGRKPGDYALQEAPQGRALWDAYVRRLTPSLMTHYRYRALVPVYACMLASAYSARGAFDGALMHLRDALDLGRGVRWVPGTVSHQAQWLGFERSKARSWHEAERAFRLALKAVPGSGEVLSNLGVTLEKQRRFAEAEKALRDGLALKPGFQAYYNLGSLYWHQKRWAEAAEVFGTAAGLRPADERARRYAVQARRLAGGGP